MSFDLEALRKKARTHGQEHVFAFWDKLSPAEQTKLAAQLNAVDFELVARLKEEFLAEKPGAKTAPKLAPAPVIAVPKTSAERDDAAAAAKAGAEALSKGRVGAFLVAGGQGTRLGLSGPKGAFEIGPLSKRTLFQVHAEKIAALRKKYGCKMPWVIMTSDANDKATEEFFAQHKFFGLGADTVRFCVQENMPAVDRAGRLLLETPGTLALSPNGHGGSIKALFDSGCTQWLRGFGVDTLYYFQVDNVLTQIGDPVFVGQHLRADAEMSSKVVRKRDWKEKVGVVGFVDGKLGVIEYSDLPESEAKATEASGELRFWAGSIAIHVLDVGFIERLNKGGFQLPYHKAEKAVPCVGADGQPVKPKPGEKNGIKFETFVFDALPLARAAITLETKREDDFAPVKNADGEDSPATARALLNGFAARALEAAGAKVPWKADGTPDCTLEVSPLAELTPENLAKWGAKEIKAGAQLQLPKP